MPLSHEHVGSKISIKIYILTRAEVLITLCYEIPCTSFGPLKVPKLLQIALVWYGESLNYMDTSFFMEITGPHLRFFWAISLGRFESLHYIIFCFDADLMQYVIEIWLCVTRKRIFKTKVDSGTGILEFDMTRVAGFPRYFSSWASKYWSSSLLITGLTQIHPTY